jgi:predicted Rossmann fold flavoprotein
LKYDVVIIGAGASGLVAAITAARQGSSVLVIEKKDAAGKKILATGNGKCNFTNRVQNSECYRSDDIAFVMKVLSVFDVHQTIQFFKELGILPKERDGYLYPNSEQASSIVSVLTMECQRLKVQFRFNETVSEIKEPLYTVITEAIEYNTFNKSPKDTKNKIGKTQETIIKKNSYYAGNLILASGGCASPKLGSDGSGYALAQSFGHAVIKPLPALVQLKSPDKFCKTISGVRTEAVVELFADNKLLVSEKGEILFTDYGISGIPVLQISRFASKALDHNEKVFLRLDLLPLLTKSELLTHLKARISSNPDRNTEEMMVGLLNHKLTYIIIKEAKLDPYKLSGQMSEQELRALADSIKEFIMIISDTNSFDNAQVCAGGIATAYINAETMESKLVKGLYFAGEILDVDGTCGGYNLQWAWSSGYLAGLSVSKAVKRYNNIGSMND